MFFLSVIRLGFLLLREAKLFSARENFYRLVWGNFLSLSFDTAKVQQFFSISKYFCNYFLIFLKEFCYLGC